MVPGAAAVSRDLEPASAYPTHLTMAPAVGEGSPTGAKRSVAAAVSADLGAEVGVGETSRKRGHGLGDGGSSLSLYIYMYIYIYQTPGPVASRQPPPPGLFEAP